MREKNDYIIGVMIYISFLFSNWSLIFEHSLQCQMVGKDSGVMLVTKFLVYTAGLNTFGQCGNSSRANHGGQSLSHVPGLAERVDHVRRVERL